MELFERPKKDAFAFPGLYDRSVPPPPVEVLLPPEPAQEQPPKKKPGRPKKVVEAAPEAQPLPLKKKGLKLTKKME